VAATWQPWRRRRAARAGRLDPDPAPRTPPAPQRFDHHQRGFTEVFGHGFATKLSSAGLVYKHYGRAIIAARMGLPEDSADVQAVWLEVYKSFIEAVGGISGCMPASVC
jgi:uncharacterized UPF0160 family protein